MLLNEYKPLFDELIGIKELQQYVHNFNLKEKEEIDIIKNKQPSKRDVYYEKFKNNDIPVNVAIALADSENTPKDIVKLLIEKNIPETIPYLFKRKDLNDINRYDLLTKTSTSMFNYIYANPQEAKFVDKQITDNVLMNAICDIKEGRKLPQHRIDVFSCSTNIEKMKEIFTFRSVPEPVIAAIINNQFLHENEFLDKCFDIGCDFNNIKLFTPYITNIVYRVSAETITEIQAKTKEEKTAQLNAVKILEKLINNRDIQDSHRKDLYERLDKMSHTDVNRSTLLKTLIKTETHSQTLAQILYSDMPTLYKRLSASNIHNISDAKLEFIDKEIKEMCERIPTSITPFNFLSHVVKNTQLKKSSYMALYNKHLAISQNEKLKNVINDIASSKATPITILEIMSVTAPYPETQFVAMLNLHCKLQPCEKDTFLYLSDMCLHSKSPSPDFKYTENVKKVLENILNDKKMDIAFIKNKIKIVKDSLDKTENPEYQYKITKKEYAIQRAELLKYIKNECNDSMYEFYKNVDKYVTSFKEIDDKLARCIEKEENVEEIR